MLVKVDRGNTDEKSNSSNVMYNNNIWGYNI